MTCTFTYFNSIPKYIVCLKTPMYIIYKIKLYCVNLSLKVPYHFRVNI